jgi:hypothetical protein
MSDTKMRREIDFDLGNGTFVKITSGVAFNGPSVPKPPPKKTGKASFFMYPCGDQEMDELRLDIDVEVEYRVPEA